MADDLDIGLSIRPLGAPPPQQAPEANPADIGASVRPLVGGGGPTNVMNTQKPDALRSLCLGVRDVAEGVGNVVGAVGDVLTYPGRAAMRAIGYKPPFPWMSDLTTAPSTQIQQAIDTTNLPKPQTDNEKTISTFTRGASGGALGGPTAGIMGGVGAVTGDAAADSPYVPEWLKPTVRLAGNIAGGAGAAKTISALGKLGNYVTGVTSPILDAFDRLRIPTNLAGTVSGSPTLQSLEAATTRLPFSSGVVRPAQQQVVDSFGDAVERTASRLSPATSAQQAGEILQTEARNWRDVVFPQRQATAWNPVNQRLAGTSVDPSNYRTALDDLTTQLGLAETQKVLTPTMVLRLKKALAVDVPAGGTMTWEQAQRLRSLLGATMGVPEIVQSVGMDALKRAYAGIAGDMRATATQHGLANEFAAANRVSTEGHSFIENTLNKIIRSNNPLQETITPEQAARNVLNSGDTTLQAVRGELPGGADALGGYKLRQMATAKPSQATAFDDTSTGTFLTNLNAMRQQKPAGTAALFPSVQQQLEDLSTVAGRLRMTEKMLNTSGTAEGIGWLSYLTAIMDSVEKGQFGQALVRGAVPPLLGPPAAKMLTNPYVARFAATPSAPPRVPARATGLLGDIASGGP